MVSVADVLRAQRDCDNALLELERLRAERDRLRARLGAIEREAAVVGQRVRDTTSEFDRLRTGLDAERLVATRRGVGPYY